MLTANLGYEVIQPAYPLDGARRQRSRGLGAAMPTLVGGGLPTLVGGRMPQLVGRGGNLAGYVEGICKEGKDFTCGPVNGVHSCRPCDYPQLAVFKDFQGQLNRIVKARGFKTSYLLDIDGRIGPYTARTLAAVSKVVTATLAPPALTQSALAAAQSAPNAESTHRAIAVVLPELDGWLQQVAAMAGAPESFPEPPSTPSDGGGDMPIPTDDGGMTPHPIGPIKKPGAGALLAMVGGVAGLGLITYGIKRYRERHG